MERKDCLLLATTASCIGLGLASFLIMPIPSPQYPVPTALFGVLTASIGMQMLWSLISMAIHICILLHCWHPYELFSYDTVFIHWIFTAVSLGFAVAGVGLVHSQDFVGSSCGASSSQSCRIRCELSSWLALAMAALSIVDALVLRWATRRTDRAAQ